MNTLFFHGFNRIVDLLKRVQDQVLRAQMHEALECMMRAFCGECDEVVNIKKQLERLQRRYDKLKE